MKTLSIALLTSLILISACTTGGMLNPVRGNGNLKTETRPVSDFSRIDFSGQGELVIQIGASTSLSISAEENLLPYLITEVADSSLRIYTQSGVAIDSTTAIVYTITTPDLSALSMSGAGTVTLSAVETAEFSLNLSGAGQINIADLQTERFNLSLSGAGSVTIAGTSAEQAIDLSGAGSYEATNFATEITRINLSGIGSANLRVSNQLDGSISGVGNLTYYGNPSVNVDRSGLGNISQAGD